MYAAVSPSENAAPVGRALAPAGLERAEGAVRVRIANAAGRSRLDRCYQSGSLKVRFPRQSDTEVPEAVLLNTAGGITGGDRFRAEAELDAGAALTLTSQAAEKIYRSSGGEGRFDVSLTLAAGARLAWLPHETILFDGGRYERRLDVIMEDDAEAVLCEAVILGRAAHGESVRDGLITDRWRVRRRGKLVYADNTTIHGNRGTDGSATLAGKRAFASLLVLAPNAEARVEPARAALEDCPATGGASGWDGMLAVRLVADDGMALRQSIIKLCNATAIRLPRAWSI